MHNIRLYLLSVILFFSSVLTNALELDRKLRDHLRGYVKNKIMIFPKSQGFDQFIMVNSTNEVVLSISKEAWLPSPKPLTLIELKSLKKKKHSQIIPHSKKRKKINPGTKTGGGVSMRLSSSSKSVRDSLMIEFEHSVHGDFNVMLSPFNQIKNIKDLEYCLDAIFAEKDINNFVISDYDNKIHERNCGHLLGNKKAIVELKDKELCNLCFVGIAPKPTNAFADIFAASKAQTEVRGKYDILVSGEYFERINDLLNKTLKIYPVKELGFSYEVQILDTSSFRLFTLGAGKIYISKGAVNLLNDNELIMLGLAHEIGHTELRHTVVHSYEMVRQANSAAFAAAFLGVAMQTAAAYAASEGYYVEAGVTSELSTLLTYTYLAALDVNMQGYSQSQEVEADIMMYAFSDKAQIDKKKVLQMFRVLRSIESRKLRGYNETDGFESHLPTNNRLSQAKNRYINFENKKIVFRSKKEKSGLMDCNIVFSGYIEHPDSTNEKFLNFILMQAETNEFVPTHSKVGELKIGKKFFSNVHKDITIGYYDTQNYLFINFNREKLKPLGEVTSLGGFTVEK